MKRKKALTLTGIVTGIAIAALCTRVPQDLSRLHTYNKKTEHVIAQHDWLVDSIRNSYTDTTPTHVIANEELAIKVSERIATERLMYWNSKKIFTIYRNKTLTKLLDIYSSLKQNKAKQEDAVQEDAIYKL